VKLAQNEKEELLLELFPTVATEYLKNRLVTNYLNEIHRVEEEKRQKYLKEKEAYDNLSPEEKQSRLMEGLYSI
jgi:oxaloacetate decarboxylase alpha subunit/pyruvate carboxylase subunit B